MLQIPRRAVVLALASGVAGIGVAAPARATVMRSMSLAALVKSSSCVAVLTPLGAESHFEDLGRRRRIVTDTRVRVEECLTRALPEAELMLRTLGGSVRKQGELVQGQARLELGRTCVAFLLQGPDGLYYVTGMAQGHYPLDTGAARRLLRSPDLPDLLDYERSAVKELVGSELSRARARILSSSEQ